jgi:uncharacterized membrane protein YfcA
MDATELLVAAMFFVVAALYSTVGHAGASGYLAVMGLAGLAPEVMRPTALLLNIAVAAFTTWRFREARFFDPRALAPFVAGSLPCAFIGGTIRLPSTLYQGIVGLLLLGSAALLVWRAYSPRFQVGERAVRVPLVPALAIGAVIGLLSGLTGTGGGIFLSPLVLLLAWAGPKATAGIAAPFIMVNSLAGLAGSSFAAHDLPEAMFAFAACALAGAFVGTWLGTRKLQSRALIVTLAVVMSIAGAKLLALAA